MKWILFFASLTVSLSSYGEDQPLATQAGEALQPLAEKASRSFSQTVLEFMAGGSGPMAEGAKSNLKIREQQDMEANRGQLRPLKECIKSGNVIDEDVQECVRGYRDKTW
jgi:hypothetical protein